MSTTLVDAVETTGRVAGVERAGEYLVVTIRSPEIARRTTPGQFVMLESGCLLRRPFSVFRADADTISVAFDVIGGGTRWLASRSLGDDLTLAGPLGHGFALDAEGPTVAVGHPVHAILGAAREARVFGHDAARRVFDSVAITTEDGSLGRKGLVTDVLAEVVAETGARRVVACGPMPMLEAVATRSKELGLECEVAVEEFMACGIGVCWTCVIPVDGGGSDARFLRSCTEGPVFEGNAVMWR